MTSKRYTRWDIGGVFTAVFHGCLSVLAFTALFALAAWHNLTHRSTAFDYCGNGTFECRKCGWRGTSAAAGYSSVAPVCPTCHPPKGPK